MGKTESLKETSTPRLDLSLFSSSSMGGMGRFCRDVSEGSLSGKQGMNHFHLVVSSSSQGMMLLARLCNTGV